MLSRTHKNLPPWSPEEQEEAYAEFLIVARAKHPSCLSARRLAQLYSQIFPSSLSPAPHISRRLFISLLAAALAIVTTLTAAFALNSGLRRFILRDRGVATDVHVYDPAMLESDGCLTYYFDSAYLPQEYTLYERQVSELTSCVMYCYQGNKKCLLEIVTMSFWTAPTIDTENKKRSEITIGDYSGYLYTSDNDSESRMLLLTPDSSIYISGYVSESEITRIAENLYKIDIQ